MDFNRKNKCRYAPSNALKTCLQIRSALNCCEDMLHLQPESSDLKPSRAFLDDVNAKTTPA